MGRSRNRRSRNRRSRNRRSRDRHSRRLQSRLLHSRYFWLALATLSLSFSFGETPIALAVWAAPIFLLRFIRDSGGWAGYLQALPAVAVGTVAAAWGMSPVPFSVVLLSAVVGAALFLLPFVLDRLVGRRLEGLAATLVLPCATVVFDWARSFVFGLGSSPAYSLRHDLGLLQLVSITGIWGLVFLPRWVAAVVNMAWEQDFEVHRVRRPVMVLVLALILVHGYGQARLAASARGEAEPSIRVAGLTPPAEHFEALDAVIVPLLSGSDPTQVAEMRTIGRQMADHLFAASEREALAGAELVAWSEAAVPMLAEDEPAFVRRAQELARRHGIYLAVTPAVAEKDFAELRDAGRQFVRNKLMLINPDGEVAWDYLKARPVPLVETHVVPGDGVLPITPTSVGPLSGVICYDLDHPALIRQAGRGDVALVLGPSNDWQSVKNYHAHPARIRAIENGFALLRPTSRGLSVAIDTYGRTVASVDYFEGGGALVAQLPITRVSTVYSRIGDLFVYLCLGGLLVLLSMSRTARNRRAEVATSPGV